MSAVSVVTSKEEIVRVLNTALVEHAEVHCETRSGRSFSLEIRSINGTSLVLSLKRDASGQTPLMKSIVGNEIVPDLDLDVVLSLVEGQYAIREKVGDVSLTTFTIRVDNSLLKLQRRSDFRVNVRIEQYSLALPSAPTSAPTSNIQTVEIPLIDLSAGGMRVLWPPHAGAAPQMGAILEGELQLSPPTAKGTADEKSAEVRFECVKDHGPENRERPDDGRAISFKFVELGQAQARTILFSCLAVHRSRYVLK